jgi:hypothetical protein
MTNENMNKTMHATDDMLADLDLRGSEADALRGLLGDVAGLANEVPTPSDDVRALLGGAVPLRSRRRAVFVSAAAATLALGGVSAAAAANRLPDRVQEVVADATGGAVPHPIKPTNPPSDAPGHVFDKTPKPDESDKPDPQNSSAPGQIQKLTKPDPTAPGPAHPADPGSHGRAHNPDKANSSDRPDNEDNDDSGGDDSGGDDSGGDDSGGGDSDGNGASQGKSDQPHGKSDQSRGNSGQH